MGEKKNERYVVALEIGSSKIRGAVGSVDPAGIVDVIAVEEEKLIDKVRYGCIQNVEVGNAISAVVQRLQAYPKIAPREITGVYVSLGGRSLISKVVEEHLTLPAETEITSQIINELYQKAAATIDADRDVVDVVPVRFTVDNQTRNNPIGTYGERLGGKMTVLSCGPQIKRMLGRVIKDRLHLNINGYVPRALAEGKLVLTDDERRLGCMFVDFGAETTTVSIYRGGSPVYVATLPIGSRNITLDLIALNYIEKRAEEIKKVSGNALSHDNINRKGVNESIDYSEINNYVHARADEIVENILVQMEYAGVRDTDLPCGIVIVGGGARLRGFNELLSQKSKMKVRQGAPTAAVRISNGSIERSDMVDVISILLAASDMPVAECLTPLPEHQEQSEKASRGTYEGDYSDEEYEGRSRIGSLDDEDEDSDRGRRQSKGGKNSAGTTGGTRRGFAAMIGNFKDRISQMMNDDSDFK